MELLLLKELEISSLNYENVLSSLKSEIKKLQSFEAIVAKGRAAQAKIIMTKTNAAEDDQK